MKPTLSDILVLIGASPFLFAGAIILIGMVALAIKQAWHGDPFLLAGVVVVGCITAGALLGPDESTGPE